jgi:hypothetical protein
MICGIIVCSVQIRNFYPGSKFFPSRIPDLGSRFYLPFLEHVLIQKSFDSIARIQAFLTHKIVTKGLKSTGSRIRIRKLIVCDHLHDERTAMQEFGFACCLLSDLVKAVYEH